MKVYFLLDDEEPNLIADELIEAIVAWLDPEDSYAQVIDNRPADMAAWELGLQLDCKRKAQMKESLDFLSKLAKKMEREFVVGLYDKRGSKENVCYFGHQEGCPDIDEVAMYLGLNR